MGHGVKLDEVQNYALLSRPGAQPGSHGRAGQPRAGTGEGRRSCSENKERSFSDKKSVPSLDPTGLVRAHTALVRPLLEYCIQARSPTTLDDVTKSEKVQRMATKLVPALWAFPYEIRACIPAVLFHEETLIAR